MPATQAPNDQNGREKDLAMKMISAFVCIALGLSIEADAQNGPTPKLSMDTDRDVLHRLQELNYSVVKRPLFRSTVPLKNYGSSEYKLSLIQAYALEISDQSIIVNLSPTDRGANNLILDGQEAELKNYPWQAALLNRSGILFCGASYIGSGWLLTAAHCFKDEATNHPVEGKDIVVLYGTDDLTSGGKRVHPIGDPVMHQHWNPKTYENDIALIRISPLAGITPAQLADATIDAQHGHPVNDLIVSGWGRTTETGQISHRLLYVSVPLTDLQTCDETYRRTLRYPVSASQICAGSNGRDSCQGDSGGPLTWRDPLSTVPGILLGLASFGFGCGRPGYPGVYTRVIQHEAWIKTVTSQYSMKR